MGNLPPFPPPAGGSFPSDSLAPLQDAPPPPAALPEVSGEAPPLPPAPQPVDPITAFRLRQAERGEDTTKPSTPAAPAPALSEEEVSRLTTLAMTPQVGEPFTLGGRTFTRQFLKMKNARQFRTNIVDALAKMGKTGEDSSILDFLRHLDTYIPTLLHLVLSDQDEAITEEWVSNLRIREGEAEEVVIAQFQLQGLGDTLGKFSAIGALLGGLAKG